MNVYQRYPNLHPPHFLSLFPPRGTCCKLPRKNGDCWSLLIIIIIAVLLYNIMIMIIFRKKSLSFNSLHERPINAHPHKCRVFVVVANPPLFSEYLWALQVFLSFIQLLGLLLLLSFFGFSIDVNSFSTSAGETFLKKRKRYLLFSFFTHIPPLSVSLSQN